MTSPQLENTSYYCNFAMDFAESPVGGGVSPITGLAIDLGSLSTTGYVATPRRRISWSKFGGDSSPEDCTGDQGDDLVTGTFPENDISFDDSKSDALPRHLKSKFLSCPAFNIDKENEKNEVAMEGSDGASQDSGYAGSLQDKELKGGKSFTSSISSRTMSSVESPLRKGSLRFDDRWSSCSSWDPEDDPVAFDDDNFTEDAQFPSGISKLLESPLCFRDVTNIVKDQPATSLLQTTTPVRPVLNKATDRQTFKRPDPPIKDCCNQQKRRRKAISFCSPSNDTNMTGEELSPNQLHRSYSESHTTVIMKAVHRSCENPNLIGDCSRSFVLPLVQGKHHDLKTISPKTAMEVLTDKYCNSVKQYTFVDCRYPYEYEGGHIVDAKNLYTKESIISELLDNPPLFDHHDCPNIVIFHCEFSSERGPSLMRFLRSKDREMNHDCYPALHYPEVYLLNGGYKAFYEAYQSFCEPQAYIPMMHKGFEKDMKTFRAKSKSWGSESKGRSSIRPGLKF